jgi:uncharacterized membrane protein (UPF0127 family)
MTAFSVRCVKLSGVLAIVMLVAFSPFVLSTPVWAGKAPIAKEQIRYLQSSQIVIETKDGQDYSFDVEMATNNEDQARGLMYRTRLNSDAGMLFLFGDEDRRTFWMKDTLIPLDLIFIGRDGVINHIHHHAKPQDETRITSGKPALAVLEINGGLAGTLNIMEGDKVIHPAFRNMGVAPR